MSRTQRNPSLDDPTNDGFRYRSTHPTDLHGGVSTGMPGPKPVRGAWARQTRDQTQGLPRLTMTAQPTDAPQYAVCIDNSDFPAALELPQDLPSASRPGRRRRGRHADHRRERGRLSLFGGWFRSNNPASRGKKVSGIGRMTVAPGTWNKDPCVISDNPGYQSLMKDLKESA